MTAKTSFRGSFTALVTPFKNGSLDEKAFRALVEWQIGEGTNGLVPVGTTGESPTLSHDEHKRVVEWCIDQADGRVPVIAGAGSNATAEAVELSQHAEKAGADAVLIVTPYYNKPTQEGMYQHFKAINDAIGIPIIIYNIPGRSVVDMSVDTMKRLFDCKNIAGVKDATASMERGSDLLRRAPKDFAIYSGEDVAGLPLMLMGGQGVISVTANVAPRLMQEMCAAALSGDIGRAREANNRLLGLHTKLFVEGNPIPVKWALAQMGLIEPGIRLPLVPLSANFHEVVREAMRQAGIQVKSGLRLVEGKAV